jgi:Ran GTPase-activating protein (RanGAP) involved in mRNA processing and transport
LDLAKNNMESGIGEFLKETLKNTSSLSKLQLEYNELGPIGAKEISLGLSLNYSLHSLNLKGNGIGDQGTNYIASSLQDCIQLRELDLSSNNISATGFAAICDVLPACGLQTLVCNRNILNDEVVIAFS